MPLPPSPIGARCMPDTPIHPALRTDVRRGNTNPQDRTTEANAYPSVLTAPPAS